MMKKIMVVDDNVSVLKQISAILENCYDIILAKSGDQALKIGAQEKPELIFLDIEMPEMDGFETFAKFKKEAWFGATPVVFLTGNMDEATKKMAFEYGAIDILAKPVNKENLLNRIELYFGGSADYESIRIRK
jgi:CheY-like chemotaxis protein